MSRAARRAAAATAAAILLTSVSACGKSAESGGGGSGGSGAKGKKVALVIAQGGLGDNSYNDLADRGFKSALRKNGITGRPVESKDIVAQARPVLEQASNGGFGLVIDLEFSHAETLPQVAKGHPKTLYALLNVPAKGANVVSVLFQEQQSSYLAGYLAAKVTTMKGNGKVNAQPTIGVVGGTKSTGIDKFIVGYIQGARAANPRVKVLTAYANSFGDPTKGKQIADSMYKRGADVVYAVAGGTGAGVIRSARANDHYAIGVDDDQDAQAKGYVLTSALKRTDLAVGQLVDGYAKGSLKGGSTITLGLPQNGVGLSPMTYTKAAVGQAIMDDVAAQKRKIEDGSTKVWNVIEQGYPSYYKG